MPNVIDLFAGAGGLSLGACRAGFNVVAAVELDAHAINSHITNFPNTKHIQRDIMSLQGSDLLTLSGINNNQLVGIIGGPPCQGFSNIGHGNVDDKRNRLFIKFFELIEELQPVFFVAENVPGIMNDKYKAIREEAFNHITNYNLLPPISVNASEYGAPTTRTRIFFIGYRDDKRINPFTEDDIELMKVPLNQRTNVRTALEGLPANIRYSSKCTGEKKLDKTYTAENAVRIQTDFFYQRVVDLRPKGVGNPEYINLYTDKHIVNGCLTTKHSPEVKHRYANLNYGQQDKVSKSIRLNPDKYCPTLRAGTGPEKGSFQAVRPIHFKYARVITPREAARLQGFPDWYKLPETIWHGFRQLGNSVSPLVAERVLSAIYQKLT
ncbi:DNA cytosine methyltransferase [Clostridium transplantifaecale]|uniref:DNA cytosine methyltransferase n=1 Tax=Clostridium transplantifaecale TaxID=2479838 RepID=UPI000F644DE6|nr:DNA cytosine methyltransferase [Clostridium transplantifaecale]